MPVFTLITEVRGSFHVTQDTSTSPQDALAKHIARLPYDDGAGPHDAELEWLQSVADGTMEVHLTELTGCRNTWLWLDGARYDPQYITYIVEAVAQQPMKALARSVIEAVRFLELTDDDVIDPDAAVEAMESITCELGKTGTAEKAALRDALGDLIVETRSTPSKSSQEEVVEFYQTFMENLGLENE